MKALIKTVLLMVGAVIRHDARAKVVFYHDVGRRYTPMGTEESVFWAHMKLLRPDDVVCFDDGFRGIWDARELFRQRNLRPKVFIAVRLVGQAGYLTWDEIRELQNEYGFDFQSHTWSHQTLAGSMIDESPKEERTEAWYERELVESRHEISHQLGREVSELCFPAGYFSKEVVDRCRKAGYRRVYASYPGNVGPDFVQPRCLVQFMLPCGVRAVLNGGMNILKRRYFARHCFG